MSKKNNKKAAKGFTENLQQVSLDVPATTKLKKGKMSKPFETALNAVERMEEKKKIH